MIDFKRLDEVKLTPAIFVGFMLVLMLMSGLAAGVGYAVSHLRRSAVPVHDQHN